MVSQNQCLMRYRERHHQNWRFFFFIPLYSRTKIGMDESKILWNICTRVISNPKEGMYFSFFRFSNSVQFCLLPRWNLNCKVQIRFRARIWWNLRNHWPYKEYTPILMVCSIPFQAKFESSWYIPQNKCRPTLLLLFRQGILIEFQQNLIQTLKSTFRSNLSSTSMLNSIQKLMSIW